MSELPKNWVEAQLGEICTKPQYGWTTKAAKKGSLKLLRTTDISGGKIDWGTVPYCEKEPDNVEKYLLQENDILVSRAGSVGVSHRMNEVPAEAVFASYLIRFKPVQMEPKFVGYFLKSDIYWEAISEFTAGIAIPNVNATKLSNLEVPIAPRHEQRRIVEKLDKLLAKVESAKARLERVPVILKRFRQAVLAAAVAGELTKDWRERNQHRVSSKECLLDDIAEYIGGYAYRSKTFLNRGTNQVIRIGNAKAMEVNFEKAPVFIPEDIASKTQKFEILPGDILISMTGTKYKRDYGYAGIMPRINGKRAFLNQRVSRLRCREQVIPKYLLFWLQTDSFLDFFFRDETGNVNQGNVGADGIKKAPIDLPSILAQKEIVKRVEAMFKIADQVEARYENAKAHVDKLSQSILAKAFQGELVPQDPNDEPAEKLLERLRRAKSV